jgi:O-methyltransferase
MIVGCARVDLSRAARRRAAAPSPRFTGKAGSGMKRTAKRLLTTGMNRMGFEFHLTRHWRIEPWNTDAGFLRVMEGVAGRTLVDPVRCYMLWQQARSTAPLGGEVAEVGVYRGGTARLLARTVQPTGRTVHLFDTFAGMPAVDAARDLHREGDFAETSLDEVRAFLAGSPNVRFYPGFFPQTAEPVRDTRFSFVHVDVDIYPSVRDCCAFFYPRLLPGGVMIFDDYGFLSCPGARQAVDEFFADKPETPCYLPTAQCMVVRACTAP